MIPRIVRRRRSGPSGSPRRPCPKTTAAIAWPAVGLLGGVAAAEPVLLGGPHLARRPCGSGPTLGGLRPGRPAAGRRSAPPARGARRAGPASAYQEADQGPAARRAGRAGRVVGEPARGAGPATPRSRPGRPVRLPGLGLAREQVDLLAADGLAQPRGRARRAPPGPGRCAGPARSSGSAAGCIGSRSPPTTARITSEEAKPRAIFLPMDMAFGLTPGPERRARRPGRCRGPRRGAGPRRRGRSGRRR